MSVDVHQPGPAFKSLLIPTASPNHVPACTTSVSAGPALSSTIQPGPVNAVATSGPALTATESLMPQLTSLMAEVCKLVQNKAAPVSSLATLPSSEITPFARNAGVSVAHWLDQMEFRLKSLNIPPRALDKWTVVTRSP